MNFCVDSMGSYQYSNLRSVFAAFVAAGLASGAWLLAVCHWETPQPRAMPAATSARATVAQLAEAVYVTVRSSESLGSLRAGQVFYRVNQTHQRVRVEGCSDGAAGRRAALSVVERAVSMRPAASTLTMPSLGWLQ